MRYLLALDQGTTSSRAIAFDAQGRVAALAQRQFAQHFPQPGWVEHDAAEIWATQRVVARECMQKLAAAQAGPAQKAIEIAAIGITNQRETTVLWDRATGQPVAPAIVWQDRRTTARCEQLRRQGKAALIQRKTGLVLLATLALVLAFTPRFKDRVGVDALAGQPRGQHAAQAGVALRLAIAHGGVEQLRRRADLAHGGGHEVGAQPVGRQHAHAGLRARVGGVEHAAHQRGGADRRVQAAGVGRVAECFGFDGCARLALGRCGRPRHRVAHEEAALRPRLHQALRQQLVVGGHHGGRADPVQRRALPHAGQARAGRQQLVADALGKALGQLVGQ